MGSFGDQPHPEASSEEKTFPSPRDRGAIGNGAKDQMQIASCAHGLTVPPFLPTAAAVLVRDLTLVISPWLGRTPALLQTLLGFCGGQSAGLLIPLTPEAGPRSTPRGTESPRTQAAGRVSRTVGNTHRPWEFLAGESPFPRLQGQFTENRAQFPKMTKGIWRQIT